MSDTTNYFPTPKQKRQEVCKNRILASDSTLLNILLKDNSSGKNIIWATDDYVQYNEIYAKDRQITIYSITGKNGSIIKPRVEKTKQEQLTRVRNKAEVFTPSWVCNKQNNLVDNAWFGRENVFNVEQEKTWTATEDKILFPTIDGKTWQDYVKSNRLEITCGEAPYLASRYDTVSGNTISVKERIGLLDRKLRVVCENVDGEKEWYEWAKQAVKSVYGYDWQGDNVLLARENLLFTFSDYYEYKFGVYPIKEYLREIAEILSWNIWQMDGLKFVIPNSCRNSKTIEYTLIGEEVHEEFCEGCRKNNRNRHNGIYCYIMDWETNKKVKFVNLLKDEVKQEEEIEVQFEAVVGNPPYQENDGGGTGSSAKALYNKFFLLSKKLSARHASMIMKSNWMTGGKGLDNFRKIMLNDTHIKVLVDYLDSSNCFSSCSIEAGVCYLLWDKLYEGECYNVLYMDNNQVNSWNRKLNEYSDEIFVRNYDGYKIFKKICKKEFESFSKYVQARNFFKIGELKSADFKEESEVGDLEILLIDSKRKRTRKFLKSKPQSLQNATRKEMCESYKIFISKADGAAGQVGFPCPAKVVGTPEIGAPNTICSETFLVVGPFTEDTVQNASKYISTKFFRFFVGLIKQKNMTQDTYQLVPVQDFTKNSDIDWSFDIKELDEEANQKYDCATINKIDAQLYKKYDLSKEEVQFIEKMIKEVIWITFIQ